MMIEKSYKAIIEDSARNRYMFYYSGSSVCCKEVSKDGLTRDTIIASQVKDNFLTAIDLQDKIYVACLNNDNGLQLYCYEKNEWKLEQILNIQGEVSIYLLSLYAHNGTTHIIYAKQMAIANFYNVYHLHKPSTLSAYHAATAWRKNNICEIYAENLGTAYSAVITKDGAIHLVTEWYDGNNYLINYHWFDNGNGGWKRKTITTLFKKDIIVNILYDDGILHLLCYTFEDELSAIFSYSKKEGSIKDFEFHCLYKINTDQAVSPSFHLENGAVYLSWVHNNKYCQYALNKEQKNWTKKVDSNIPSNENLQSLEYIRNRKGKALIVKRTYFTIDFKYNINLPYFRDNSSDNADMSEGKQLRNADGDLVRYIPYILDELKSLSEIVKSLKQQMDSGEVKVKPEPETKKQPEPPRLSAEHLQKLDEKSRLKKSSFRDQFMNSNKLIGRPEATALFVGASSIPNPDNFSNKAAIPVVENQYDKPEKPPAKQSAPIAEEKLHEQTESAPGDNVVKQAAPVLKENKIEQFAAVDNTNLSEREHHSNVDNSDHPRQELDAAQKDTNLFKKIGDFFK